MQMAHLTLQIQTLAQQTEMPPPMLEVELHQKSPLPVRGIHCGKATTQQERFRNVDKSSQ